MDLIYKTVAGLDVHQKTIMVCVRAIQPQGGVAEQVKTFGTMTSDLLQMSDWLAAQGVTNVAMESTGVLWKPVWNILEGVFELLLVNPVELKRVPGRKSDVRDCQWIAHLLQCGLLRSSFVAPRALRELRDLTRYRAQLMAESTRCINRVHKTLEDANIKLGAVASDIMGKSGRAMLCALLQGERDPRKLAELAQGQLRGKIPELTRALEGRITEHHCFLLRSLIDHLGYVEGQIELLSTRIANCLRPLLDDDKMERLDEIPGVNRRTVENVIAEIGPDMSQFPDEDHLSSWAGMSPGNEESAGKRIRKRTKKGNRWLRRALVEAAWAASHTKRSYLGAQYRRLAARRGKKRALVAVGHTLLVIFYHLLKEKVRYVDLGPDYFDKLKPEQFRRYLVKRLESLGYVVTLEPKDHAA
ncbi:MAG: IS110 family transposase [Terriglobales bacterium]